MTARAQVAVVDDDASVRDALCQFLSLRGYRASGYPSADAYLDKANPKLIHCLVLDMLLPGISGLELLERIHGTPSPPCIVITGHGDVLLAVRAMKLGAVDFLQKPVAALALLEAVRSALTTGANQPARERLAKLSPREHQVAELILEGKTTPMIAEQLGVGDRTIDTHRGRILEKLEARNVADLVRIMMLAHSDTR